MINQETISAIKEAKNMYKNNPMSGEDEDKVEIEKAENGFIVCCCEAEFIADTMEKAFEIASEFLKEEKEKKVVTKKY